MAFFNHLQGCTARLRLLQKDGMQPLSSVDPCVHNNDTCNPSFQA
jgi:hypothetical protein